MATYIVLGNFTEKGIKAVRDTPKRFEAFREVAKKAGITVKDGFWTLGAYDLVLVIEAPDDESVTALLLGAGEEGFVKSQTLRAFAEPEMKKILSKMA